MERPTPPTRRLISPTVLAVVAVTLPAAMAGDLHAAGPHGEATAMSQQRADLLVRAVSEAARQLCGSQAAVVCEPDGMPRVVPLRWEGVVLPREDRLAPICLIQPSLIDLPPPAMR